MKTPKKYNGVVVPMVTPFTEDRKIDPGGIEALVNHVIASGAHPFIIGTTGESASISRPDRMNLVRETVNVTKGRTLVYAGISNNSLQDSVNDAKAYHDLGVSVAVATMPSYYPVDEQQMQYYFEELANSIPCPLIIYNIPATTHLSIPVHVVDKLSTHENIVGFKDSEKGIERIDQSTALWKDRADFSYLLGWALQSSYAMEKGADGLVPSTGNLAPALYKVIIDAMLNGQVREAARAQDKADKISEVYQKGRSLSHSLAALKAMLSGYDLCQPYMLPPLYKMGEAEQKNIIATTIERFGDLNKINSVN